MRKRNKIYGFFISKKQWVFLSQTIGILGSVGFGKLIAIYIAPDTFGQYSLILGMEAFFAAFFFQPINHSFQYALQKEDKNIAISYYLKVFIKLTYLSVLFYLSISLFGFFSILHIPFLLVITFFSSHFKFFLGYINLEFKFKMYGKLEILNRLLPLILFTLIVIFFGFQKIESLLLILAISFFISFLIEIILINEKYVLLILKKIAFTKQKLLCNDMIGYAKPLAFMALFAWISNYADKYIIEYFWGTKEVGYYSAGYSLGTKFFLSTVTPFLILLRADIFEMKKLKKLPKTGFKKTISHIQYFAGLGIIVLLFFIFGYNFIGKLFLSITYFPAFKVIPIIAGAFFMLTLSYFFEVTFYAWNKVQYILYANIIGAIINVAINLILIPVYNIQGAAIATLVGYGIQLTTILIFYYRMIRKNNRG